MPWVKVSATGLRKWVGELPDADTKRKPARRKPQPEQRARHPGNRKLTEQQVLMIRELYFSMNPRMPIGIFAEMMQMSRENLLHILRRKSWNHLPLTPSEKPYVPIWTKRPGR